MLAYRNIKIQLLSDTQIGGLLVQAKPNIFLRTQSSTAQISCQRQVTKTFSQYHLQCRNLGLFRPEKDLL